MTVVALSSQVHALSHARSWLLADIERSNLVIVQEVTFNEYQRKIDYKEMFRWNLGFRNSSSQHT